MQTFTIKSSGMTSIYELDEASGILHYIVRDGRNVLSRQEIKLHNIDAEYSECANLRELPFWRSVFALVTTFLAIPCVFGLIWGFVTQGMLIIPAWMLVIIGLWLVCLWRMLHGWKNCRDGCFVLQSRFHYDVEIDYVRGKRQDALKIAEIISKYCKQLHPPAVALAEHRFKNGLVKLFEDWMVFYNQFGVKSESYDYTGLSPKVSYHADKSIVGNIICGTLAVIFFIAALFMFGFGIGWIIYRMIVGTVDVVDILTLISLVVVGVIPLALGRFFWSWCQPNEKYYAIVENNDYGIGARLEVGKDTADEREFIKTLKMLLRNAHKNKSAERDCTPKPDPDELAIQEPEYEPINHITITIRIIAGVLNGFCCVVLSMWKKKFPVCSIVAVTILIWLSAELLNNYLVRRKK